MTPIIDGDHTYQIADLETLATVLTEDALNESFTPQTRCSGPTSYTAAMWADMIEASPPAKSSQVEPRTILGVLALALQGGGMLAKDAIDTAERLWRGQNARHFDFLAARIVHAVVAAGVK